MTQNSSIISLLASHSPQNDSSRVVTFDSHTPSIKPTASSALSKTPIIPGLVQSTPYIDIQRRSSRGSSHLENQRFSYQQISTVAVPGLSIPSRQINAITHENSPHANNHSHFDLDSSDESSNEKDNLSNYGSEPRDGHEDDDACCGISVQFENIHFANHFTHNSSYNNSSIEEGGSMALSLSSSSSTRQNIVSATLHDSRLSAAEKSLENPVLSVSNKAHSSSFLQNALLSTSKPSTPKINKHRRNSNSSSNILFPHRRPSFLIESKSKVRPKSKGTSSHPAIATSNGHGSREHLPKHSNATNRRNKKSVPSLGNTFKVKSKSKFGGKPKESINVSTESVDEHFDDTPFNDPCMCCDKIYDSSLKGSDSIYCSEKCRIKDLKNSSLPIPSSISSPDDNISSTSAYRSRRASFTLGGNDNDASSWHVPSSSHFNKQAGPSIQQARDLRCTCSVCSNCKNCAGNKRQSQVEPAPRMERMVSEPAIYAHGNPSIYGTSYLSKYYMNSSAGPSYTDLSLHHEIEYLKESKRRQSLIETQNESNLLLSNLGKSINRSLSLRRQHSAYRSEEKDRNESSSSTETQSSGCHNCKKFNYSSASFTKVKNTVPSTNGSNAGSGSFTDLSPLETRQSLLSKNIKKEISSCPPINTQLLAKTSYLDNIEDNTVPLLFPQIGSPTTMVIHDVCVVSKANSSCSLVCAPFLDKDLDSICDTASIKTEGSVSSEEDNVSENCAFSTSFDIIAVSRDIYGSQQKSYGCPKSEDIAVGTVSTISSPRTIMGDVSSVTVDCLKSPTLAMKALTRALKLSSEKK